MERHPVAPPPIPNRAERRERADSEAWTQSALTAPPGTNQDDWVVTNTVRPLDVGDGDGDGADAETGAHHDDGTPVEGFTVVPSGGSIGAENAFVAGEIDVPTPAPEAVDAKTPQVEFTAASKLLGNNEPDPDTGSRTPPLERRSGS